MVQTAINHVCNTSSSRTAAVIRTIERMKQNLCEPLSLVDLAEVALFSPFYFHRLFLDTTTMTPARFLAALRMAEAKRQLLHSRLTVATISTMVGYTSAGTFTTQFTRLVGESPARFRQLARRLMGRPGSGSLLGVPGGKKENGLVIITRGANTGGLVLLRLQRLDDAPEQADVWALGVAREPIRLAPVAGEFRLQAIATNPRFSVTDALVDEIPGSYLTSSELLRLPVGQARQRLEVTLGPPRPTDPPVLTAAPLRRLAELAGDAQNTARA